MNSIALFLGACIPMRLFVAWLSTRLPREYLSYYAGILALVGLAFLYLYFTRGRQIAPEAGGPTWWESYRLLIGTLWLTAATYAFQGRLDVAWIPLVIDVLFGLVIFYLKHFA